MSSCVGPQDVGEFRSKGLRAGGCAPPSPPPWPGPVGVLGAGCGGAGLALHRPRPVPDDLHVNNVSFADLVEPAASLPRPDSKIEAQRQQLQRGQGTVEATMVCAPCSADGTASCAGPGHSLAGNAPSPSIPPPPPPPPAQVSAGVCKPPRGLGGCIWMPLVNGTGNSPSPGRPTPGVVKQDKSSGGSVDTTKTRSDPQRVRMCSGERPMGAAKGKQPNTEALCQPPPPPPPHPSEAETKVWTSNLPPICGPFNRFHFSLEENFCF